MISKIRTGVTESPEDTLSPDNILSDPEVQDVTEDAEDHAANETEKSDEHEKTEDIQSSEAENLSDGTVPDSEHPKKSRKPRKPVSTKRLIINLIIKIAVILLALWVTFTFILGITINHGNNMHPAINDGDLIVSLRVQRPYLNAAVLYHHGGKMRVGRVVGLSGNVIDISENGELLVDGSVAAEEIFFPTQKAEDSDIMFPYTVEDGKAFILNDYREDTSDSRSFGAVDIDDIDGPILFILRRRGF